MLRFETRSDPVLYPNIYLRVVEWHFGTTKLERVDGIKLNCLDASPIEIFPKRPTDAVQCNGIDAAVGKRQAKAEDPKVVPESVVILLRGGMNVKPQHEYVLREETHREHYHERHYHLGHLFARLHLPHLEWNTFEG